MYYNKVAGLFTLGMIYKSVHVAELRSNAKDTVSHTRGVICGIYAHAWLELPLFADSLWSNCNYYYFILISDTNLTSECSNRVSTSCDKHKSLNFYVGELFETIIGR